MVRPYSCVTVQRSHSARDASIPREPWQKPSCSILKLRSVPHRAIARREAFKMVLLIVTVPPRLIAALLVMSLHASICAVVYCNWCCSTPHIAQPNPSLTTTPWLIPTWLWRNESAAVFASYKHAICIEFLPTLQNPSIVCRMLCPSPKLPNAQPAALCLVSSCRPQGQPLPPFRWRIIRAASHLLGVVLFLAGFWVRVKGYENYRRAVEERAVCGTINRVGGPSRRGWYVAL